MSPTDLPPRAALLGSKAAPRPGFGPATGLAVSSLLVVFAGMSVIGLSVPELYRRETPSYALQALGQDWVDVLVAVPWLALSARAARRGSRRGRLLLAGGLLYAVYEFAIYAFAVHFNRLFLAYCAGLGLSTYAFVTTTAGLLRDDVRSWFAARTPVRGPAGFLIGVGTSFALLWLSELVPALVRGAIPSSVTDAALPTNPVHVLDLSLVLPAHVWTGLLLFRKRAAGYCLAPVLLGFDALMAASIMSVAAAMYLHGAAPVGLVLATLALSLAAAGLLTRLFRGLD